MRPSVIVVGAGLGGCVLANALVEKWDVTMVEMGVRDIGLESRVIDLGKAAITTPHLASGLGGTTRVWHNGLIEIAESVFRDRWPFSKSELDNYYVRAFEMLSDIPRSNILHAEELLRQNFVDCGISSALFQEGLFYPSRRVNAWKALRLQGRVRLIRGEVTALSMDKTDKRITGLKVRLAQGDVEMKADEIVLACGGIGTPVLLQRLSSVSGVPPLRRAGFNYEDHPSGFVAEFVSDAPFYRLWNRRVTSSAGHLRLPIVIIQDGLRVSFQLRPATQYGGRNRIVSVLSELRNNPLDWRNYLRLLVHWDDILDILSLRFGLQVPTRNYSLLMVAEQPPSNTQDILDIEGGRIGRNWNLSATYIDTLRNAIKRALVELGPVIKSVRIFPDWENNIFSSSHHSGTARMHQSPEYGVCNEFGQVHGIDNLHVCDGSAIPASGNANTGLTIAALALRMADTLISKRCQSK